ncbi:MAG: FeS-binding protein [Desulfobacteraceae bacterium]|nr:FeS-binding protein [Desulfobacteraceae bacterium]
MSAEDRLRYEINKCRNCEACKTLLNSSCVLFPEMFRLVDEERETGEKISTDGLRKLVNLCNFCAACPCLDIRVAIMEAKTEYMDRYGLGFKIRLIEDVERIGKLGGALPQLTNVLCKNRVARSLMEKGVGIHMDRKIPSFPKENFPIWIKRHKTNIEARGRDKKKVAYFVGCSAKYFFPEVPKAVVEVFERNGIEVYYPEQQCCGMPSLLEGDRKLTLEFARFQVPGLAEAVEEGYDIVCSCPTCGYMLKKILKVGAYYSAEYRDLVKSSDGFVKIPIGESPLSSTYGGFVHFPVDLFKGMLRDEGYFSSISPKKRIMVAENSYDVGEYLRMLHERGELDTRFGPVSVRATYYPPCHLREQRIGREILVSIPSTPFHFSFRLKEQRIGRPYQDLLGLIPGLSLDTISGDYCCGNAGIMGFKQEFHQLSIKIASRLIAKIKSMNPEVLVTDCLSCRIQFNQLTLYKVLHPIQIIGESYSNYQEQSERKAV